MKPSHTIIFSFIFISFIGCFGCSLNESPEQRVKRLSDELSSVSGDGDLTKMKDLIALGADINGRR